MVLVPFAYAWDFTTLQLRRSLVLRPGAQRSSPRAHEQRGLMTALIGRNGPHQRFQGRERICSDLSPARTPCFAQQSVGTHFHRTEQNRPALACRINRCGVPRTNRASTACAIQGLYVRLMPRVPRQRKMGPDLREVRGEGNGSARAVRVCPCGFVNEGLQEGDLHAREAERRTNAGRATYLVVLHGLRRAHAARVG